MSSDVPHAVHLWYLNPLEERDEGLRRRCAELLSEDERERWNRFAFEDDRLTYLVSHALVRLTLSRYADVAPDVLAFTIGEHGRPEVLDEQNADGLRFSLSHTKGLAVCAITAVHAVGVDAETYNPGVDNSEVAERFFAASEARALRELSYDAQHRHFMDLWTLKEAYLKACGRGLSVPLHQVEFSFGGAGEASEAATAGALEARRDTSSVRVHFGDGIPDSPSDWQFARFDLGLMHRIAVAIRRGTGADRPIELRPANLETLLQGRGDSDLP